MIVLQHGIIYIFRNGRSLGEAFNTVRQGPGLAYFPAVSLSLGENLRANFGATPLRYPMEGYRPLQDAPTVDLIRAQQLFTYLERLLPNMLVQDRVSSLHCAILILSRIHETLSTGLLHFTIDFYRPQTKLLKGNVFTPVTSVCSQGGGVHPRADTPQGRHNPPPPTDIPPQQTPPPGRHPTRQTPPRRPLQQTVRILLECILVFLVLCSRPVYTKR